MGDKSPKQNAKHQKQHKSEKNQKQSDAKAKQERPAEGIPGKRTK
jgi:hypothetical protein